MERPYPAHWEADVVLRDGRTAHLRPIVPADADRLVAFYSRLSEETIYYRFFAPYPRLTDQDVARFTTVDHVDRVAIVAEVGADLIAVARYDRVTPHEAEVAFNIEDAHQGRGLGSVLLEHVAAAARERGIGRFVAEVLPTNRRMFSVFKDAGYEVSRQFEDGVFRLYFDLEPTATSIGVMQAREHRAEARSVERLLRPGSVAVVGAGRQRGGIGNAALRHLVAAGFTGELHAVNPAATDVEGVPAYPSVLDVPGCPDLAVVAVPVESVQQVVLDCARKGVRGLVVVSAGYAETGAEGRDRQRLLVRTARAHGMRVVGPNSFGMINTDPDLRLNASLSPVMPERGRVGFFAQSGALGIAILQTARQRGLGLSTFVSAGNRADVSGNDLLQFWEEDPGTEVVLLYLESIGNPRKFSRIARRVGRHKPIVAVKSGGSTQGVPLGHPVRESAVPPEAVDAMFRQAGVIRVDNIHQLFDVGQLLATQPLPTGRRVAVVSNSAALGLLTADACHAWQLELATDPVALPAEASGEDFRDALRRTFARPDVDSVVAGFIPPLVAPDEDVARVLAEMASGTGRTVVSTFLGIRGVPEQLRAAGEGIAPRGSVPSYPTPEDAVRTLAAATRYAQWRGRPVGEIPELAQVRPDRARELVSELLAPRGEGADAGSDELGYDDLAALLECYGVRLWPAVAVTGVEAAVRAATGLGYPVALKTTAEHLRHRPDLADVRLNLASEADVRAAWLGLAHVFGEDAATHLVVQPMAPPGVAVVVAGAEDPLFGPVVSFGLGGLATELLGDRAYRIPPLTDVDARDMVRSVRAAPLLFGHRGAEPVDVGAVHDLLLRVSRLTDDLPEVAELELNPVLVSAQGLAVLNARCRLARPLARTDRGPRHLSD